MRPLDHPVAAAQPLPYPLMKHLERLLRGLLCQLVAGGKVVGRIEVGETLHQIVGGELLGHTLDHIAKAGEQRGQFHHNTYLLIGIF